MGTGREQVVERGKQEGRGGKGSEGGKPKYTAADLTHPTASHQLEDPHGHWRGAPGTELAAVSC